MRTPQSHEARGIALTVARYALLTSLLLHGFILILAGLDLLPWQPIFLAALISLGWIVLSSIACLTLQLFALLRRPPRR